MKLSSLLCRHVFVAAIILGSWSMSLADNPPTWDGHFSWTNRGNESDHGNVTQNVDLFIKTNSNNVEIGLTISWRPGAMVEIGAALLQSAITTEIDPNGNTVQVLAFDFTDGFENTGTGRVVINGNTATVSLDATETLEGRATRQYGDYTLTRRL